MSVKYYRILGVYYFIHIKFTCYSFIYWICLVFCELQRMWYIDKTFVSPEKNVCFNFNRKGDSFSLKEDKTSFSQEEKTDWDSLGRERKWSPAL